MALYSSRSALACLAILVAAAAALAARQAAPPRTAQPFTVVSPDGRHPLPVVQVGDQLMASLDDLAVVFHLTVKEDALAGGVSVASRNKLVVLTPGQPVASANGRLVSLPAPLTRDGKRWLVPVEFISRALAVIYDAKLELRRNSHLVLEGDVRVPRLTVRQESSAAQAHVTIDVSPRTPHTVVQEPTRLLVRFDSDALDVTLPAVSPQGLLQAIRLADPNTTLALDLGPRFASYRTSVVPSEGGSQIVVDLVAETPPSIFPRPVTPPPAPPQQAPAPAPEMPAPGAPLANGLKAIVIDPGHGGEEPGAKGPAGTTEKDVTLSIARRLKAAIESRLGIRVLLTRDGDQTVPLDDRAALANNNKADLFLSLHANASVRKEVSGAEIFYLSADQTGEDARRAAETRQSLPALGGGSRDIEMILWEMAQVRYLSESASLAGAIEEQFRGRVRLNARPVQQAPFRVLAGANMPAVLVEVGFLTNADEEQQLLSDAYQNLVVQALLDAIIRFRDQLHRTAPPAPPVPPAAPAPQGGPGGGRR